MSPGAEDFAPLFVFDWENLKHQVITARDRERGWYTKFQNYVAEANKEALHWIQAEAGRNLVEKIERHGRPQEFNSGRLLRAIYDDRYSEASKDAIRFMIDSKVRRDVPYYGAIEYGSDYWPMSGRMLPFLFLGGVSNARFIQQTPSAARGQRFRPEAFTRAPARRDPVVRGGGTMRGDRMVGPREYQKRGMISPRKMIRITKPVPEYRYGRDAADRFLADHVYEQILQKYVKQALDAAGSKTLFNGIKQDPNA